MHKDANEDVFYSAFGHRVAEQRRRAGLSQESVARRIGLTRASISNLEAGRQRPLIHQAVAIAEVLNVELSDLIPDPDLLQSDRDQQRLEALHTRYSGIAITST